MKKVINLLCMSYFALWLPAYSQSVFQKHYGGSNEDHPTSLVETPDSGFIISGYSRSFVSGSNRSFLMKTDIVGNLLWTKYFSDSLVNSFSRIIQTPTGNLLLIGTINSPFTTGMIVYTDSNANELWAKTWSSEVKAAVHTTDGGFLLVGRGSAPVYGMLINKIDSLGTVQWSKDLRSWNGFISTLGIINASQTNDGGIVFTGLMTIAPGGFAKVLLMKTDGNGNVLWAKTLGPGSVYYDGGISVFNTADNGYIVTGTTVDSTGHKIYHIKTDSLGSVSWAKRIGFQNLWTSPYEIVKKDNDHILISAFYEEINGDDIGLLMELDDAGTLLWSRSYADESSSQRPMIITSDGIVYSTTTSTQDVQLIKTDHWGHLYCNDSTVVIPVINAVISDSSVAVTDSSGAAWAPLAISAFSFSFNQTTFCDSVLSNVSVIQAEEKIVAWPNPSSGTIHIDFEQPNQDISIFLTDLYGQELKKSFIGNSNSVTLEFTGSEGIYFLHIVSNNKRSILKIIKI